MNKQRPLSQTLVAVCIAGLAPLLATSTVGAEGPSACGLLLQSSMSQVSSPQQLRVVRTQNLFRVQQRPYVVIPEGAAIWLRAPEGITATDLYQRLNACTQSADEAGTPLCVQGARISLELDRGYYLLTVKSDLRTAALEIQRRAARF
jgi:hypothetical protein